ncbi:hypothetical protein ABTD49_20850, partial [Acinetobacter baumannii]
KKKKREKKITKQKQQHKTTALCFVFSFFSCYAFFVVLFSFVIQKGVVGREGRAVKRKVAQQKINWKEKKKSKRPEGKRQEGKR